MFAPQEKARLRNSERPCSEEEREAVSTATKWGTLENMKFAYHGSTNVKIEEGITCRAPVTSKPPPPKPPITFSSDKPVGKGAEKGKEIPVGVQTRKGVSAKESIPKGKDNSEGKEAK